MTGAPGIEGPMREGKAIRLRGDPMATSVLALRLMASDPHLSVFAPLDDLLQTEGEVFPGDHGISALDQLVTMEWPAYLRRVDGDLQRIKAKVALLDPVQAYEALLGAGVRPPCAAPQDAETIDLPRLDPVIQPSKILEAQDPIPLDLPILHEPAEEAGTGRYTQVLPLGGGMVMVRERLARGALLSVQRQLLGQDAD